MTENILDSNFDLLLYLFSTVVSYSELDICGFSKADKFLNEQCAGFML